MGFSKSLLGSQRTLMASNGPQWVKIGLHKWTWFFFVSMFQWIAIIFWSKPRFPPSSWHRISVSSIRDVFLLFFYGFLSVVDRGRLPPRDWPLQTAIQTGYWIRDVLFGVERWLLAEVFFSFFSFFFYSSFVGWMIAATELRGCLFRVTRHFGGNQFDVIRRKLISTHDTLWLVAGGLMVASGWSEEEKKRPSCQKWKPQRGIASLAPSLVDSKQQSLWFSQPHRKTEMNQ